ncbi:hypothetical protein T459_17434 [Capsicum annuum]|uniref:Uncharacterized protein n=1 Tax=Capsicum annuum TaxID=4072 RepID=A0A2G2ZBL1_CAPAN|nr:hypothetical protein FXO37_00823 [Capsicum annuum]PHT79382.1 hypothetical protein T459_17434 [Capsicum annuum]
MAVAEVVVVGGNYMGAWEEGPNCWKWISATKETVPISLRRKGSYDDIVRSVIERRELECEPKNIMISYVMNGPRPLLRINIIPGSSTIPPPQPTIDEHDLFEDEGLDAHPMDSKDDSM